jgi:ribosomal protein S18 acetylase RimI-like enzyme
MHFRRLTEPDTHLLNTFFGETLRTDPEAWGESLETIRRFTARDCYNILAEKFSFGALHGKQLVGLGTLKQGPPDKDDKPREAVGLIQNVHVLLSHRRRGIAKRIMQELIRAGGYLEELELWVLRENIHAIHIYESLGFEEAPDNESEVRMRMVRKRQ